MEFSYIIAINSQLFDVTQIKISNVASVHLEIASAQTTETEVPWSTNKIKFVSDSGSPWQFLQ